MLFCAIYDISMTSPIICGQLPSLSRFMMTDTPTDSGFAAPPVLTVSALNQAVARLLERSFPFMAAEAPGALQLAE